MDLTTVDVEAGLIWDFCIPEIREGKSEVEGTETHVTGRKPYVQGVFETTRAKLQARTEGRGGSAVGRSACALKVLLRVIENAN